MIYEDPHREKIKVFFKKNGNVVSREKPRFVKTGNMPDYSNPKANKFIRDEISQMKFEIRKSEKASSHLQRKEGSYDVSHRVYNKSTFPDWYRTIGLGNSREFERVADSKKGVRYSRIKKVAIKRLNEGHISSHGYDLPNMKFKVASRQYFDNKNVIFRKVRGKIVPIRVPQRERYDLMEEAPF